jgi:hypothetical protein
MNEVVVDESTNDASPAVAGIHVGLRVEQQSHDRRLTLAGGDVQRDASIGQCCRRPLPIGAAPPPRGGYSVL